MCKRNRPKFTNVEINISPIFYFDHHCRRMLHKLLPENRIKCKISEQLFRILLWASGFLLLMISVFSLCTYVVAPDSAEKRTKSLNWLDDVMNCSSNTITNCNYEKIDLKNIMEAIERGLDFFENHVDVLVLDAAIGTKLLESQLHLFQLGHSNLPPTFQALLAEIKQRCQRLSDAIINRTMSTEMLPKERQLMAQNLFWVEEPSLWESPSIGNWQSENRTDVVFVSNKTIETIWSDGELTNENITNECIDDIHLECNVSTKCVELFMETIPSKYSLTHQILFFHFAKKKNCFNDKKFRQNMGKTTPEKFVHLMCNKVWEEANVIQKSGFPPLLRDLISEQIVVCSVVGYAKFLKLSWLKAILSWQRESGCFTFDGDTRMLENSKPNRRVKREDNFVEIGAEKCSVHYTTVAFSAIAMHLRYFGDTCLASY